MQSRENSCRVARIYVLVPGQSELIDFKLYWNKELLCAMEEVTRSGSEILYCSTNKEPITRTYSHSTLLSFTANMPFDHPYMLMHKMGMLQSSFDIEDGLIASRLLKVTDRKDTIGEIFPLHVKDHPAELTISNAMCMIPYTIQFVSTRDEDEV